MTALMYTLAVSMRSLFRKLQTRALKLLTQKHLPQTATRISTQLQKAKESGAELVFLPIYYTEASLILQQANTMGYAPQFFGCDGMDGILQVENFDVKLAEGLMLLTPFAADATDDLTVNFVKSYEEAYGETQSSSLQMLMMQFTSSRLLWKKQM